MGKNTANYNLSEALIEFPNANEFIVSTNYIRLLKKFANELVDEFKESGNLTPYIPINKFEEIKMEINSLDSFLKRHKLSFVAKNIINRFNSKFITFISEGKKIEATNRTTTRNTKRSKAANATSKKISKNVAANSSGQKSKNSNSSRSSRNIRNKTK